MFKKTPRSAYPNTAAQPSAVHIETNKTFWYSLVHIGTWLWSPYVSKKTTTKNKQKKKRFTGIGSLYPHFCQLRAQTHVKKQTNKQKKQYKKEEENEYKFHSLIPHVSLPLSPFQLEGLIHLSRTPVHLCSPGGEAVHLQWQPVLWPSPLTNPGLELFEGPTRNTESGTRKTKNGNVYLRTKIMITQ